MKSKFGVGVFSNHLQISEKEDERGGGGFEVGDDGCVGCEGGDDGCVGCGVGCEEAELGRIA